MENYTNFYDHNGARSKSPIKRLQYSNPIRSINNSCGGNSSTEHDVSNYSSRFNYDQRHFNSKDIDSRVIGRSPDTGTSSVLRPTSIRNQIRQYDGSNLFPDINKSFPASLNVPTTRSPMLYQMNFNTSNPLLNTTNSVANLSINEESKPNSQTSNVMDNLENIRYLQGTIERVIKWNKIFRDNLCHYEVIGNVVSIQEGTVRLQKIMLLRDNRGPILQVAYYTTTYIDIENFHIGQKLRCIGRMLGNNIMHAIKIKTATEEDINYLQRHCYISDHAISNTFKLSNKFH